MKPEIQKLWSDALRSGEFQQATGTLTRTASPNWVDDTTGNVPEATIGSCCLGVACELAIKDEVISKTKETRDDGETVYIYGSNEEEGSAYLPSEVQEWMGVTDRNVYFDMTDFDFEPFGGLKYGQEQASHKNDGKIIIEASILNDSYVFTFEQIADLIDEGRIVPKPKFTW